MTKAQQTKVEKRLEEFSRMTLEQKKFFLEQAFMRLESTESIGEASGLFSEIGRDQFNINYMG
jgi:hypothetical protein